MNHDEPYAEEYIRDILKSVRSIAMVGASPDKAKFSYGVLKFLHDAGYEMIPVNPRLGLTEILGIKVYPTLAAIGRPVDMVDVFRPSEDLMGITRQAIAIGAKVIWGQIGVRDDAAARQAEEAGVKVVMNRCPKIEIVGSVWEP